MECKNIGCGIISCAEDPANSSFQIRARPDCGENWYELVMEVPGKMQRLKTVVFLWEDLTRTIDSIDDVTEW